VRVGVGVGVGVRVRVGVGVHAEEQPPAGDAEQRRLRGVLIGRRVGEGGVHLRRGPEEALDVGVHERAGAEEAAALGGVRG
jgi:hypothetical protein